jgi:hypothetical protein
MVTIATQRRRSSLLIQDNLHLPVVRQLFAEGAIDAHVLKRDDEPVAPFSIGPRGALLVQSGRGGKLARK